MGKRRATGSPVYNARILTMLSRTPCAFGLLLWLLFAPAAAGSQWSTPDSQLAQKIAAATGPGAVALNLVNRSSLSQSEVDEVRRGLLTELGALGVHFVAEDQAAATVRVFLSENLQSYVWLAEIHQGNNEPLVVMVSVLRSGAGGSGQPATTPMTIRKMPLWTDDNRILDVAQPGGNSQVLVVLEADRVLLLTLQSGRWQQTQSLAIPHRLPWPRDLRGHVLPRKEHLFDVYLPGVFCQSTTTAPLGLSCHESDDPWPLSGAEFGLRGFFAASRNFFTGVLAPGIQKQTTTSPFYTAAPVPREGYTLWLFSSADGQIHLLDGMTDQAAGRLNWGSDIAAVRSACGLGWQVLATSQGAGPGDAVTAFQIADREPVAVSPALEFDGGLTALWSEADATSAVAVLHESQTGRYESYRLSIACQ